MDNGVGAILPCCCADAWLDDCSGICVSNGTVFWFVRRHPHACRFRSFKRCAIFAWRGRIHRLLGV